MQRLDEDKYKFKDYRIEAAQKAGTVKIMRIFIVIGILLMVVGYFVYIVDKDESENATASANATIVSWESEEEYDAGARIYKTVYYATISFTAGDQSVQEKYEKGYDSEAYDVGSTVKIRYNPNDTKSVIIDDSSSISASRWMIPGGAVMFAAALVVLIVKRVQRKKSSK